jgi:iron complex outermembrane receptor protein
MKQLIDILHREGLTLVVRRENGEIHRFTQRGVKDLLTLVTERPEVLHGALIADKAVGKAAAACMVVGGVRQVYADVMSEPALALLKAHSIEADYGQLVDHIINRAGTDWCPMERLSRDESDPAVIITKIREFFNAQ